MRLHCSLIALLGALPIAYGLAAAEEPKPAPSGPASRPAVEIHITIGPETTWLNAPLRDDGTVDYPMVLNWRAAEGATPRNNAAGPLLKLLGPKALPERARAAASKQLSISLDAVAEADRFKPFEQFLAGRSAKAPPADEVAQCRTNPWHRMQHPVLGEWIDANSRALDAAVDASRLSCFALPRVWDDPHGPIQEGTLTLLLPPPQLLELAQALAMRALLRFGEAGEENIENGREDLMAVHRLARLLAKGPTIHDYHLGLRMEVAALRAEQGVAGASILAPGWAAGIRRELEELPAIPPPVNAINLGERVNMLNFVTEAARAQRNGSRDWIAILGKPPADGDWDPILRQINRWYERQLAAIREPTCAGRQRAIAALVADQQELAAGLAHKSVREMSPEQVVFSQYMLPLDAILDASEKVAAMRELTIVELALAAYVPNTARFPAKLDVLVPQDLPALPVDHFTGKPLQYRANGMSYTLAVSAPTAPADAPRNAADVQPDDLRASVQYRE